MKTFKDHQAEKISARGHQLRKQAAELKIRHENETDPQKKKDLLMRHHASLGSSYEHDARHLEKKLKSLSGPEADSHKAKIKDLRKKSEHHDNEASKLF